MKTLAFSSQRIRRFLGNHSTLSPLFFQSHLLIHYPRGCCEVAPKCLNRQIIVGGCNVGGAAWIHSGRALSSADYAVEHTSNAGDGSCNSLPRNRKKLKGKRAVVRWLKFFRWKKKRDFERMTPEEKILFKLTKARRKEQRLLEALKKIEPKETSEASHDPEILTPEEHFYYLKMGEKCKNYVPVGRRGIYKGVILNMHLHWKKHETLKVIVKTFSAEEVREIAVELARYSGGIVLDIQGDDTIIMYRGKNYSQPPTEIMSPRSTLSRTKALDKSKYRDALSAVRRYIPRLEQDLQLLQAQSETNLDVSKNEEGRPTDSCNADPRSDYGGNFEGSDRLQELLARSDVDEEESDVDSADMGSDSEALSDIFETDSVSETDDEAQRSPLLDALDKIPVREEEGDEEDDDDEDFEEHLRRISADSRKEKTSQEDVEPLKLDEAGRMILKAASLLKKKKKR